LGQASLAELDSLAKDERLYVELWTSLASLLRSYTALHGLIGKKQATVEQDAQRILVSCESNWLELKRNRSVIAWQRADGRSGTMEFTEAGKLRFGLGVELQQGEEQQDEEEMDMTAESWARDLTQELPQ